MLMNNLDPKVAEHPEDLVVYGGARPGHPLEDDAIVETLRGWRPTTMLVGRTELIASPHPTMVASRC